ncbi:hypothetical protein BC831DRAFT_477849 [Entophlyctis helioformis]|nr:hypothetical protein BC831DRAFT_477849 [Entophlyctis helioformis]
MHRWTCARLAPRVGSWPPRLATTARHHGTPQQLANQQPILQLNEAANQHATLRNGLNHQLKSQKLNFSKNMLTSTRASTAFACRRHCTCSLSCNEVAERIKQRVDDIDVLPHGIPTMSFAVQIKDWYTTSRRELLEFSEDVEEMLAAGHRAGAAGSDRPVVRGVAGETGLGWMAAGMAGLWSSARSVLSGGDAGMHAVVAGAGAGVGVASAIAHAAVSATAAAMPAPAATHASLPLAASASAATDLSRLQYGQDLPADASHLARAAPKLNRRFVTILERLVARHRPVVLLTAHAAHQLSRTIPEFNQESSPQVQDFLSRFHRNRIGVRLLIGHHRALQVPLPLDNMVGILCTKTNIDEIASEAINEASDVCESTYGVAPDVYIMPPEPVSDAARTSASASKTVNGVSIGSGHDGFVYVPSHLQHILFELLKNAMRAVIEATEAKLGRGNADRSSMPPVVIAWTVTDTSVRITITDRGVGIPASKLDHAFLFHFSTADHPALSQPEFDMQSLLSGDSPLAGQHAPMAGFGYGLPLSRVYARYLGGDLRLESTVGQGTTVTLDLKRHWGLGDVVISGRADGL